MKATVSAGSLVLKNRIARVLAALAPSVPVPLGLALIALVSPAAAAPGDVLHHLSTPGSTPTGLTFDGRDLWVADRLADTLYALDPTTGEARRQIPAPGFIPRGLAWDGSHLWCVDGEENRISRLDPNTGVTVRSFESPTPNPHGLTWDGSDLWLADQSEDVLCKISPVDGTVIERFTAPMKVSTGLAWWNGYLWCGDRKEDRIYLVAPDHGGEVVLSLEAPGDHVRGLTHDGESLWAADYQEDAIFRLVIEDDETRKSTEPHTLDLLLTQEFRNYGPGEVTELDVYIAVPRELPSQKLLTGPEFTPSPDEIVRDRWDQPVAHFRLHDLPLAERRQIRMSVRTELAAVRHFVFPHLVGELEDLPEEVRERYLVDEDKYRLEDPRIRKAVSEAVGDETNPYWMMRNIHRHIRERMHYELAGGWNVAPRVLERGNGSCSEYTFVFIAMCRAAGVPARYVGSVVIRGDEASTDEVFHRWSQVYLPGYGWVHVDPQGGDKELPGQVAESIGVLSNRFLITTEGGGNSEYLGWNYNHDERWRSRGPVKVHVEAVGEWSPVEGTEENEEG
jgi:transglutaminase-like putative cysteine protease